MDMTIWCTNVDLEEFKCVRCGDGKIKTKLDFTYLLRVFIEANHDNVI